MITVLVASYNGSRYTKQQLDSILAQDEKDIHILVSDDRSADGSGELLKEYEERYWDRILVPGESLPGSSCPFPEAP